MHVATGPASEDDLRRFAELNPSLRVELSARGVLIVSPPTGGWSVHCEDEIFVQVHTWNRRAEYGMPFGSQGTFRLPNGSILIPDVSVVQRGRYDALSAEEQDGILPLCPDIVIEVKSSSDERRQLIAKLATFRSNGASVTLLFDPAGYVEVHDVRGHRVLDAPNNVELHAPDADEPLMIDLHELYRHPV